MSLNPEHHYPDNVETVIVPRTRDLGGFEVRRALPTIERRMVGPFVFFDQAGPAEFLTGEGIDVRPHPHIGLGTVTYLFNGEFHHRDSLGTDQIIRPGAVNWMVAGKAVTHSERSPSPLRAGPHSLLGIQTWIALPEGAEDDAARFEHHGKDELPMITDTGVSSRLILGCAFGERAPVGVYNDMFYLDMALEPGASAPLPDDHEDRALYILKGEVEIAGDRFEAGRLVVFRPGDAMSFTAGPEGARVLALGGETLNGPRHMWWNFVSSSKEKIEEARVHWEEERWGQGIFDLPPGDDSEWIPAPKRK